MFSEKGQTLLELIVVVTVSVIVVSALVFAIIASLRNASFSKNQAQATKLAQEGIERVRVGRDRNQCINDLDNVNVKSWNGNSSNTTCSGTGSIWTYQITGSSSNCENLTTSSKCYFKVVDSNGSLRMIAYNFTPSAAVPFPLAAEPIPPFQRAITLSDDLATYERQKTVTAIVRWSDFSGPHESRLTTILRKIQ